MQMSLLFSTSCHVALCYAVHFSAGVLTADVKTDIRGIRISFKAYLLTPYTIEVVSIQAKNTDNGVDMMHGYCSFSERVNAERGQREKLMYELFALSQSRLTANS